MIGWIIKNGEAKKKIQNDHTRTRDLLQMTGTHGHGGQRNVF